MSSNRSFTPLRRRPDVPRTGERESTTEMEGPLKVLLLLARSVPKKREKVERRLEGVEGRETGSSRAVRGSSMLFRNGSLTSLESSSCKCTLFSSTALPEVGPARRENQVDLRLRWAFRRTRSALRTSLRIWSYSAFIWRCRALSESGAGSVAGALRVGVEADRRARG